MATSIASQLQALKSVVKANAEPPAKRPFIRPSILFDPKDAADIDIDTIFNLALSGLEVLISKDEKFSGFKRDLFNHKSKDLDRELVGVQENNRINGTITSYLKLLSGYFLLPAAQRTLEYLIRRYKVHVYNTEELILCTLPYHDTREFVRVVQLIDTGNGRWKFLDGVKKSGAPPPRQVIVQQCIRDLGVLEVICNFATSAKKVQPRKAVTGFCTAVIIEILGSMTAVNSDVVNRILPYVVSGLQPGARGDIEQKAGALMIVGLLAQKTKLSSNLVKSLMRAVVDVAQEDTEESNDLQWFRLPLMALINIVQLQHVVLIPRKSMDILVEFRDISEILGELTEEFNTDGFLGVFLNSLLEYSSADQAYHHTLMVIIEKIPLKFQVECLVSKLLKTCMKISRNTNPPNACESGGHTKEILVSLYKKYPIELCEAIKKILQDNKMQSEKEGNHELFLKILDGDGDSSIRVPDSKMLFALEHPRAEVRRAALMGLDVVSVLRDKGVDIKVFDVIQDALVRHLLDDDLTVVQAVLSVQHLNKIIESSILLDKFQMMLDRCMSILMSGASDNTSLACDVAVSCLQQVIMTFKDEDEFTKKLAEMILPLLLILPKTQKVNFEALELAKDVKWPLFGNLVSPSGREKKLGLEHISSVNFKNISKLAEDFQKHGDKLMPWLLECSKTNQMSKTLCFFILLQSSMVLKPDFVQFSSIFDASFQMLQREWEMLELVGSISNAEESNLRNIDGDCRTFLKRLLHTSGSELNAEILICLCWRLVEGFIATAPEKDKNKMWLGKLQNLFVFFITRASRVFKKHLHYLVAKCKSSLLGFLSNMFTEEVFAGQVQAESLRCFEHLCSLAQAEKDLQLQLLNEFPSLLVPLASNDQDVRVAAMGCIEELFKLCSHVNFSRCKNGNSFVWIHCLGELLGLMVQKKMLILSDTNVLASIFKSLLSSSTESLLVEENIGKRFDQSTEDDILGFLLSSTLKLSDFAKLKIFSLLKGLGNKVVDNRDVKALLGMLLERRKEYHIMCNNPTQKLSKIEVDILCLLLEICSLPAVSFDGHDFKDHVIVKALEVNGSTSEDPTVVKPCITVLKHLTNSLYGRLKDETKEILFQNLVILLRNGNVDMQNSAREALLKINISSLVVGKMLDFVVHHLSSFSGFTLGKTKRQFIAHQANMYLDVFHRGESASSFLSSLLDALILKKNMENRSSFVGSLFELLGLFFMNDKLVHGPLDEANNCFQASSGVSETVSSSQVYIQQTLLLILEDISSSAINSVTEKDHLVNKFDLELLVKCARLSRDQVTRNHVFSLFSTVAKVMPDKVLNHILDVSNIIGESAVTKWDAYSQRVFEEFISAVVPFWLSEKRNAENLLQIFVNVLPKIPQHHQKLSIVICLLRNLGECESFGSLLFLLFNSLIQKDGLFSLAVGKPSADYLNSVINTQWEYVFAQELSAQYSCMTWLPSLILLLQRVGTLGNKENYLQLRVAMQFVLKKLQDPEISFKVESGEDADTIQVKLGALMVQVVYLLQQVNAREKQTAVSSVIRKGLKELMRVVLKAIVKNLLPISYFEVMVQLLGHADKNVRKKALGLLCETAKESDSINKSNQRRLSGKSLRSSWLQFDETAQKSFNKMCLEILKLVDDSDSDLGGASLKLAAVSTLEALANRFPLDDLILVMCLKSVIKNIRSSNSTVSSVCLRTASALIHVLGPRALCELPGIMEYMLLKSRDITLFIAEDTSNHGDDSSALSRNSKDSVVISFLIALEAIVDKLGGFLNPYLVGILELLVLHHCYSSTEDVKIKLRADSVRKLVTEKIPVRLLLPALLRLYTDAIKHGGSSVSIAFEMLGNMVHTMDRSSVAAYHVQIFDLGLLALDLRCQHGDLIKDIHVVEEKVINSIVSLTMKLTETMFKPLFVKSIEWSRSYMEGNEGSKNIDRSLSFYGLVNKLVESHRSLFVPYFKYLLDGCVHHLSEDAQVSSARKKKRLKPEGGIEKKETGNKVSLGTWHLRALITSSLQKCFLYDTGSLKFLDSSNFQVLLKPIVSQLLVDPPPSLEQHPEIPSVKAVDDLLVGCIGQMAVTTGSDLLWKPLNHEVLMQTRSEKVRSRMLGLRIVKYLVENLKEEYLVLVPETIPFLGELLEDVELPIKTLAQEIVKQMEFMSGECLRDYL